MRKLFVVPMLLFLVVVPTALAATGVPAIGAGASFDEESPSRRSAGFVDFFDARIARRRAEARVEARERRERSARRREAKAKAVAAPAVPAHLQAIASCESGGDPNAISSNGTYRGKYQFSTATWQGVGGTGDPAAAPEAEQDKRAAMLYARSGAGQWPVCGS